VPRTTSAAIGLVVLVCGACTPHTSTTPARGPHLTGAAVDLLTGSGDYPARKHVLDTAEEQLNKRCMTARGQAYQPFVPPLVAGSDEERALDLPRRRVEGYGLAPGASPPPSAAPNADRPQYQQALFGDDRHQQGLQLPSGAVLSYPTAGCLAESRAALYGDVVRWARTVSIPQIFDNDLRSQVKNAPELAEANSRWASCIATAGHPYPTSEAAVNDISTAYQQHGPTAELRNREIAIATIDGECALRAHKPRTELELRRAKAASLPVDQRRELNELAALHCAAYRNALHVVPGNASGC
jgi:hypothetical protein